MARNGTYRTDPHVPGVSSGAPPGCGPGSEPPGVSSGAPPGCGPGGAPPSVAVTLPASKPGVQCPYAGLYRKLPLRYTMVEWEGSQQRHLLTAEGRSGHRFLGPFRAIEPTHQTRPAYAPPSESPGWIPQS